MTKFETVGIGFQMEAQTADEAQRSFAYSCRVCSGKGLQIECDRCGINAVHNEILAYLSDEGFSQKQIEGACGSCKVS
jgi:hypothetical protein